MKNNNFKIRVATPDHIIFAESITDEMYHSALARGTGIARRSPDYIAEKMKEGKAVIAFDVNGKWIGFCYIEAWSHGKFVANSGLIVTPEYRKTGIATLIKKRIFELSREKYPDARIFGLTTGLAVMKINSELGYEPVTYSELTTDEEFWSGCKSCVNFDILKSKNRTNCLCTAMLYDPEKSKDISVTTENFKKRSKLYERFMRIKKSRFLKLLKRKGRRRFLFSKYRKRKP